MLSGRNVSKIKEDAQEKGDLGIVAEVRQLFLILNVYQYVQWNVSISKMTFENGYKISEKFKHEVRLGLQ